MGGTVKDKFSYFIKNTWSAEQIQEIAQEAAIASLTAGTGASSITASDIAVTSASGVILYSQDGSAFRLTVTNGGSLTALAV